MSRTLHAPVSIPVGIVAQWCADKVHVEQYFIAKKMTPMEIAVYMQEHKLDYYTFGFFAALLESRKQHPQPSILVEPR